MTSRHCPIFFFFNDTATTEIYTLSLHDALPISMCGYSSRKNACLCLCNACRSEEHTPELQSRLHLVCRLLLEKKKNNYIRVGGPCYNDRPTCVASSERHMSA